MKASKELKSLFQELVKIDTLQFGRRDWALIKFKSMTPFNQFSLKELMFNS